MDYKTKLSDPRWQKKRLEILERDNWHCQYCWDDETTLHVHHLKYTEKQPYKEPSENLITCCKDCHRMLEYFKTTLSVLKMSKFKGDEGWATYLVLDSDLEVHIEFLPKDDSERIIDLGSTSNSRLIRFITYPNA